MKIYLDLLLFLNFSFDFLLLLSISIILKRRKNTNKILVGSFIGSLSTLLLFLNINSFTLFLFKFFISIIMVIISFNFKNIKYTLKNLLYLYINSIILGGFLYFLNIQFSYKNEGIVFYHSGLSINYILLIVLSPIILYIYIKQIKEFKTNYSNYYDVKIIINNKTYNYKGFVDTGNKLVDIITKRPVILINKKKLIFDINEFKMILVPFKTINESSILTCIKIDKLFINNKEVFKKVLLGLIDRDIKIDDIDILLNPIIMEE